MRRAFDERESIMLNAAYNTYETVMNAQNLTSISGYAYDEQGRALKMRESCCIAARTESCSMRARPMRTVATALWFRAKADSTNFAL